MAIDLVLKSFPPHIGYQFSDGGVWNSCVFADDIVLFSSTSSGMQSLLDTASLRLSVMGLKINFLKSFSVSIIPSGKQKKHKIVSSRLFVNGFPIKALDIDDEFDYLGIPFLATSFKRLAVPNLLLSKLERLRRAPLNP